MTFGALETSREEAQPIELYEFRFGVQAVFWTTNPVPVTYDTFTYTPIPIRRSTILINPDERASVLSVEVPANTQLVRGYINSVPGRLVTLTIRRVHRNDTANQVVQVFKGVLQSVGFSQDGMMAQIHIMPISGELENSIPRFVYSRVCNHVLFDEQCGVSSTAFRHIGNVSGATFDTLTVSGLGAKGNGWAAGGFVATAANDFRLILEHTGDTIRLLIPFPSPPLGLEVEVFSGCDHSAETCQSKFANTLSNGGFPFVPLKNPFETGIENA